MRAKTGTLRKAASLLARVVPTRYANPLLLFVRMRTEPGRIALFGSDGNVDLEVSLPAEVEGGASFLVPFSPFFQIVRSASSPEVRMAHEENALKIEAGPFRTHLTIAPSEGYPDPAPPGGDEGESEERLTLQAGDLLRGLEAVRYAASRESQYHSDTAGVHLDMGPHGLHLVATDRYRLALYALPLTKLPKRKATVPNQGVEEIVHLLHTVGAEEAVLALGKGVALLEALGAELEGRLGIRLIGESYPDYTRILPQDHLARITFEGPALREALRRALILTDRSAHRVDLFFREGAVLFRGEGDYGASEELLPVEVDHRHPATPLPQAMAFNARHLLEAVAPITGKVHLHLNLPPSLPAFIKDEGGAYTAIVVPLKV